MIIQIIGWDGEHRQTRLFDVPDATVEELQTFVSVGQAWGELAARLEHLREKEYATIAFTPTSELDGYYRQRLIAMYVWEQLSEFEVEPNLTWEFPQR